MTLEAVRRPTIGLGTITPSGNVVVERVTTAVLADFPEVSGHYSRLPVHGSTDSYADSYDWESMLSAATLLSHAAPAALCWNGSKAGSIGFDHDRELCRRVTDATGIPATTATLALDAALRAIGAKRVALVTPFGAAYANKIPPHFAAAGYQVVALEYAGLTDNLSYASIPDADIVAMAHRAAAATPDAVVAYCTNLPAAHLAPGLEQGLGIPVFDSTSAGVWGLLRLAEQKTAPGARWGSLFGMDIAL